MKAKTIIRKLKGRKIEEIIVKRYASGEFLIKSIPSYALDRPDTDYVNPDTFKVMRELEDSAIAQSEEHDAS